MRKLETPVIPIAYTAPRAAAALDVGYDFFRQHIAPELKPVRRGEKTLFSVSELERWVVQNSEAPMGEQVA
jgi:hypothetical protein